MTDDIEEELITFSTAKLAKEKGFTIHCRHYYYEDDGELGYNEDFPMNSWNDRIFAPTQSLLQKWLREVHNIIIEILIFDKGFLEKDKFCYQFRVYNNTEDWFTGLEFKTYEQTLEVGLVEGLKIIC